MHFLGLHENIAPQIPMVDYHFTSQNGNFDKFWGQCGGGGGGGGGGGCCGCCCCCCRSNPYFLLEASVWNALSFVISQLHKITSATIVVEKRFGDMWINNQVLGAFKDAVLVDSETSICLVWLFCSIGWYHVLIHVWSTSQRLIHKFLRDIPIIPFIL